MKTKIAPALTDSGYAEARRRLAEIITEHKACLRRIGALEEEARGGSGKSTPADRILDAAWALIRGKDAAPSPDAAAEKRRELLSDLYRKVPIFESAIRLQTEACECLLAPLTRTACEAARDEHQAAVRRIIAAVRELDAANVAEHDLRESLEAAGFRVNSSMRPMPFRAIGQLREPDSRAAMYLLEAYEHGFIGIADVPEKLRPWARARVAKPEKVATATPKANADGWVAA